MDKDTEQALGIVRGWTKPGCCGHNYPIGHCPYHNPEPVKREPPDAVENYTETHPAFALIQANRVSSTGTTLYGSEIDHRNYVTIEIKRAESERRYSQEKHYAREEYIEVALSESQWATLVSSLNSGPGVPCTLQSRNGKRISILLPPPKVTEQFSTELKENSAVALKTLADLRALIESGKGGKKAALSMLNKIEQEIGVNSTFVADQFTEYMEDRVEKAKVEIEAHMNAAVMRRGMQAIAGDRPLALPAGEEAGPP